MGTKTQLPHNDDCYCAKCVQSPPELECDDTPKLIKGVIHTPLSIYLNPYGKAWVYYIKEDGEQGSMKLWSWGTYPDAIPSEKVNSDD